MSWFALLLSAAAAAGLLLLVRWIRGDGGRDDLMGPGKRKPRHLPGEELDRMTAMVGRGEEEDVRRQLKQAGYSEAGTRRLIWLMRKLAAADDEAGARP